MMPLPLLNGRYQNVLTTAPRSTFEAFKAACEVIKHEMQLASGQHRVEIWRSQSDGSAEDMWDQVVVKD